MPNKKSVQETVRNCSNQTFVFLIFLSRDESGYKDRRVEGPEVDGPKLNGQNVGRPKVNVFVAERSLNIFQRPIALY